MVRKLGGGVNGHDECRPAKIFSRGCVWVRWMDRGSMRDSSERNFMTFRFAIAEGLSGNGVHFAWAKMKSKEKTNAVCARDRLRNGWISIRLKAVSERSEQCDWFAIPILFVALNEVSLASDWEMNLQNPRRNLSSRQTRTVYFVAAGRRAIQWPDAGFKSLVKFCNIIPRTSNLPLTPFLQRLENVLNKSS